MCKTVLNKITNLYIFTIIIIFPLLVDKTGFFKIMEFKWNAFLTIFLTYLISAIVVYFYFFIFKKDNAFKKFKLSKIQILALIYLIVNVISVVLSPFKTTHNLFIGVGRGEGLIMIACYVLSFLLISIFGKFDRKQINYFSISSILISSVCILQYIGFNPFNIYQNGIGTHNVSFMGTIGNIDFLSAVYVLLLCISYASYIFLKQDRYEKVLSLLSIFMGSFIIGIINVDSGKLAFVFIAAITFPFVLINNKRLSKFLNIIACILFAYAINTIINPEFHYSSMSLGLYPKFTIFSFLLLLFGILLIILGKVLNKNKYEIKQTKPFIKRCIIVYFILFIGAILVLYFIQVKSGMIYEIHELLHGNFDDKFGTYRVFLWKRVFTIFIDYPLIGTGPDTFAIRFMSRYTSDIMAIGHLTVNDTAANVYLTILVNTGVLGLISYLNFIIALLIKSLKSNNILSHSLMVGIIGYLVQDFFNLSVVIVSPLLWVSFGILYLSAKNVDNNHTKKYNFI